MAAVVIALTGLCDLPSISTRRKRSKKRWQIRSRAPTMHLLAVGQSFDDRLPRSLTTFTLVYQLLPQVKDL